MASLVLSGDTSGSVTLSAPAVAGSNTQTLAAVTGTLAPIVSDTAKASTSGTTVDFTGIPSWVKRITVIFQGVSLSATAQMLVQLGTGATPTYTTSGYTSVATAVTSTPATSNSTAGFIIRSDTASQAASLIMTIVNITGNSWVSSHTGRQSATTSFMGAGDVSLSGVLTAVRVTSTSTDTFDAGTINILYE